MKRSRYSPLNFVQVTIHTSLLRFKKVSISVKADLKGSDQSCRENWFTQFTLTYQ